MALDCVLETESGESVERLDDRAGVLNDLVPSVQDATFQCWRFIDLYGDTVFNNLQMPQFLTELAIVRGKTLDPAAQAVLDKLEGLARRCRDEVHLYLKFYGD